MFNYTLLQVLWWMIMGLILVVYASTAGFDLGITMMMPFFRNENERRVILNTSAPTWDGNQTWLVFAGGGLFVVWPVVYSTAFSGMYAAMLFILWPFCLRPPGYDYRSKINSHRWRRSWDLALFISSFFPVFIFGLILGNCFIGFPFYFDPVTMRQFWDGNFWQLLNGFAVLCGFISITMVVMHGATYLQRRTLGTIRETAKRIHLVFSLLLLVLFSIAGFWLLNGITGYVLVSQPADPTVAPLANQVTTGVGAWFANFTRYPWKFYPPVLVYITLILAMLANLRRAYTTCFWLSTFVVGSLIASAGFTLYPFIMPSSVKLNQSITIWNATSSQYALNIMLYVGVVLLLVILAYKLFAYYHLWHTQKTISEKDVAANEHLFY